MPVPTRRLSRFGMMISSFAIRSTPAARSLPHIGSLAFDCGRLVSSGCSASSDDAKHLGFEDLLWYNIPSLFGLLWTSAKGVGFSGSRTRSVVDFEIEAA